MSGDALPASWRWALLREVAEINPRRPAINRSDDKITSFIPMEAVDEFAGNAVNRMRPYGEVKKGYTYFESGDVLFAKITPCMENGKITIAQDLVDGYGFGTTEFHVIRPGSHITASWLHRFLRQPRVRIAAAGAFTGAVGQQRVPPAFLSELRLPVPPILEQQRITAAIDAATAEANAAARAAGAQASLATDLVQIALEALFSDAIRDCDEIALGEMCEIDGPLVDPRLPAYSHLPCVSAEHILSGSGKMMTVPTALNQKLISGKYVFQEGAVLYSKLRPYLRKVALAQFEGLCSADMYPLRAKQNVEPGFLQCILLSDDFSAYADSLSRRARMPKLNQNQLFSYMAPCPSSSVQREFLARYDVALAAIREAQAAIAGQKAALGLLQSAILNAAFQGEL